MYFVYLARNRITGKPYVGETGLSIPARWKQHCKDAKRHSRHTVPVENAIAKYGAVAFEIVELDRCETLDQANALELEWTWRLDAWAPVGYNLRAGNGRGSQSAQSKLLDRLAHLGRHHSPETRRMMSLSRKGFTITPEQREKQAAALRGRKMTPEHRAHLEPSYAKRRGVPLSEERRRKLVAGATGRIPSDAQRHKMSVAMRMLRNSPEGRLRFAKAGFKRGDHLTAEARAKISLAARNRAPWSLERRAKQSIALKLAYQTGRHRMTVLSPERRLAHSLAVKKAWGEGRYKPHGQSEETRARLSAIVRAHHAKLTPDERRLMSERARLSLAANRLARRAATLNLPARPCASEEVPFDLVT